MPPQEPTLNSKNTLSVPLAILAAGAMVAAAVFFGGTRVQVDNTASSQSAPLKASPITQNDHLLGSRDAQIVIVEYSDFECPFCKSFHTTLHKVVSAYDGKVAWVYRHFPIVELHSRAFREAEASECAAEQGGNTTFWNYIDKLFERTKSNDTLDPKELTNIASELNLDLQKFDNCLSSGTYKGKIENSIREAVEAGARGTPYSIIFKDGKVIEGDTRSLNGYLTFEQIKPILDSLLDN